MLNKKIFIFLTWETFYIFALIKSHEYAQICKLSNQHPVTISTPPYSYYPDYAMRLV